MACSGPRRTRWPLWPLRRERERKGQLGKGGLDVTPLSRREALVLLGSTSWAARAAAPPGRDVGRRDELARLVRQLGSTSYHERQAASTALERIGAPAL